MKPSKLSGKAVVLLSGGLDSATTLAIAKHKYSELYAITFDYQQRHARELESARSLASALAVDKHLIIDIGLRDIGGSALTSDLEVPKKGIRNSALRTGKNLAARTSKLQSPIPVTYVPARNTIFLSFALGWAEVLEAGAIVIGANAVDYSGYPDCRPEYLRSFEKMANLATKASVEGRLRFHIEAPLISMTKAEIIRKGIELGIDYSLTWSCYDPQPAATVRTSASGNNPTKSKCRQEQVFLPCRKCDSCRLRQKGFREAHIKDPLIS